MTKQPDKKRAKEKSQESHIDAETHLLAYTEFPFLKNGKLEAIIYTQSTSKVEWGKSSPNLTLSQRISKDAVELFCVGHLLLAMGPVLSSLFSQ